MARINNISEEHYTEIGRALVSCQLFEGQFLASVEVLFGSATTLEELRANRGSIIDALRVPNGRVLKRLKTDGRISTELHDRISSWIDKRNRLVHGDHFGVFDSIDGEIHRHGDIEFCRQLNSETHNLILVFLEELKTRLKQLKGGL